jgi:EpsI family protein
MGDRLRLITSIGLLVGTFLFLHIYSHGKAVPLRAPLDLFPKTVARWRLSKSLSLGKDVFNILKPTDYLWRLYEDSRGRDLELLIGYWDRQKMGDQIHSPKNCLPGSGWYPLDASRVTIPVQASYGAITVNRYLVAKGDARQLVFYWYQVREKVIASEYEARLEMFKSAIFHNRTDASLIRISSPIYESPSETSDILTNYIQAVYPILATFLE